MVDMTMDNEELSRQLTLLFSRIKRVELLKKHNFTEEQSFVKDSMELVEVSKKNLRLMGFDIEQYLHSPQGIAHYEMHCFEDKWDDEAIKRCGSCTELSFDGNKFKCLMGLDTFNHVCKAFNNTGMSYDQRLYHNLERCEKCCHAIKSPIEELGFDDISCDKKMNMLSKECPLEG